MAGTKIISFIGSHEGFVSTWYLDPTGTPTIGHGFTWSSRVFRDWWLAKHGRKMRRGDTISRADAAIVLQKLISAEYGPPVDRAFSGQPDNVRDPAKSLVFNAGIGALQWKWAAAIINNKLSEGVRRWRRTATKSRGKRLPGLVRRRAEEADIAQFNRWPEWLEGVAGARVPREDVRQAQEWLNSLGFKAGPVDGLLGPRTIAAINRFQADHGTLKVDGLLGPATLSGLQRAIDLKNKGIVTTGAGGAASGGGLSLEAGGNDLGFWGDVLLWGGILVVVLGLAWLAWRYRFELKTIARKL